MGSPVAGFERLDALARGPEPLAGEGAGVLRLDAEGVEDVCNAGFSLNGHRISPGSGSRKALRKEKDIRP